jgi:hypothetical protein
MRDFDFVTGEPKELEISYSSGLETWMAEQGVSLAFAIPPAKLFLLGLHDDGRLCAFERTFNKCMGLSAASSDTLYLGTRYQIWRLEEWAPGRHALPGLRPLLCPPAGVDDRLHQLSRRRGRR